MRSEHVRRHLVLVAAAGSVLAGGITVAANAGGYPIKCSTGQVWVAHTDGTNTGPYTTITEGIARFWLESHKSDWSIRWAFSR